MKTARLLLCAAMLGLGAGTLQANMKKFDVGQKLDQMKAQLNLTDSQADQVKQILKNEKDQVDNACDAADNQIKQVLNSSQKDQYEKMKDQWDKNR